MGKTHTPGRAYKETTFQQLRSFCETARLGSLTARGYKWVRRIDINSWYVPPDNPMSVSPIGRLQFLRKYYLGTPFRHLREAVRRVRHRTAQRQS